MKKLSLLLLFFCSLTFWAQKSNSTFDEKIYSFQSVKEKPVFVGGNEKLQEILKENFIKSGITLDRKSKNKVFVLFTIEKNGSITDASVVSKIKLKEEKKIIEVFEKLLTWKSGTFHNKPVRIRHSYEITEILK
jgi:hypothetical protein